MLGTVVKVSNITPTGSKDKRVRKVSFVINSSLLILNNCKVQRVPEKMRHTDFFT